MEAKGLNVQKEIITCLTSFLEAEIQAGRRLAPLDGEAVARFLAMPESPERTQKPTPLLPQQKTVKEIAQAVAKCQRCDLFKTRTQTVPGSGKSNQPDILFIGDAPEAEDDAGGQPFTGKAGELLTNMITAMGYDRDEVFITPIAKCRPPENRAPTHDEVSTCLTWLNNQIRLIQPACIVVLGDVALRGLENNPRLDVNNVHGIWRKFGTIPVMPTFHPDYLLRFPAAKRQAWDDLKIVLKHLDKTPPNRAKKQPPKT